MAHAISISQRVFCHTFYAHINTFSNDKVNMKTNLTLFTFLKHATVIQYKMYCSQFKIAKQQYIYIYACIKIAIITCSPSATIVLFLADITGTSQMEEAASQGRLPAMGGPTSKRDPEARGNPVIPNLNLEKYFVLKIFILTSFLY